MLHTSGQLTLQEAAAHIVMSAVLGFFIFLSYAISHRGTIYSKKFNASLVVLTVLTGTVMTVIGNNIALSLGMVGALSIIRFRTAIKDPRDAIFIFWAIMVGICCGVAQYSIALASSIVLLLFFLFAKLIRDDRRYILIIRCSADAMEDVKVLTYLHFPASRLSVQNTTANSAEFIFELKKDPAAKNSKFLKEIYACEGVECANFVLQEDANNI
jgi:uncharacterized membrane protein YhiD involved in acid resistance